MAAELAYGGMSERKAAAKANAAYGLDKPTVKRKATKSTTHRKKLRMSGQAVPLIGPGRRTFDDEVEHQLLETIRLLRSLKFTVYKEQVMAGAHEAWRQLPEHQRKFKKPPGRSWYRCFLKRHGLSTKDQRPVELLREKWFTPSNMLRHFDLLEEELHQRGYIAVNPDYDAATPESVKFVWTSEGEDHCVSFDETRVSMSLEVVSRYKGQETICVEGDDGATHGGKSPAVATLVGGSAVSGRGLPMYLIPPATTALKTRWLQDAPKTDTIHPETGQPETAVFAPPNQKGTAQAFA